jgi:hypothetical protein
MTRTSIGLLVALTVATSALRAQVKQQSTAVTRRLAPAAPAPAADSASGYVLDLVSLKAAHIWFKDIGKHDLAILTLSAWDTEGDHGEVKIIPVKIANGATISLGAVRLFGPRRVAGTLHIEGDLMLAHPQHLQNVRAALMRLAQVEGYVTQVIGEAHGDEAVIILGKVIQKKEVARALADVHTELAKAVGTVACGGSNPLVYTMSNTNDLTQSELEHTAGREFKLLSFHRGAQVKTCGREIVYDPIVARLSKQ